MKQETNKTPDENTYFFHSQALVGAEKQVEVKKGVKILMWLLGTLSRTLRSECPLSG